MSRDAKSEQSHPRPGYHGYQQQNRRRRRVAVCVMTVTGPAWRKTSKVAPCLIAFFPPEELDLLFNASVKAGRLKKMRGMNNRNEGLGMQNDLSFSFWVFFFFCIKPKQSYQRYETGIDAEACASATRSVHLSVGATQPCNLKCKLTRKPQGRSGVKSINQSTKRQKNPPKKFYY